MYGVGTYVAPSTVPGLVMPGRFLQGLSGLGCSSCRGTCGMGLFDSGMDFSQWTYAEWGVVALAGYILFSVVSTTNRGARRVSRKVRAAAKA